MSEKSLKIRIPVHLPYHQREVLRHLSDGLTTKQIADRMKRSHKTIEEHRIKLMRSTGLFSYQELTKLAIRLGMTTIDV